ncbi:saccharopine dehydrogenase C-terminal domain-containing protein [Candidatus Neomarinimicrobiota bacterium]
MRIIVLGGGLVGSAMARDLAADNNFAVTIADRNPAVREALSSQYGLRTIDVDATNKADLTKAVGEFDLVIGSVPGFMGYQMLETVIEAGKDIVDISFFPEDPMQLDAKARQHGVTAITDAGLQPGLGNLILGRYIEEYDSVDEFVCYVGGLAQVRRWPFEYQSVFSPIDVLEEYTRPARMMRNGKLAVKPALSEIELIDMPHVGTLEAFNSDGLRTLLDTVDVPNMVEKTLRYPGHAERMLMLRELGLFSRDKIVVDGQKVAPIDVTSKLMFDAWQPRENEFDLVSLRIEIKGQKAGKPCTTTFDMYDEHDLTNNVTSMARTTGYTCTSAARMVLAGLYNEKGIKPLEFIGANKAAFDSIVSDLAARDIMLDIKEVQG